MVKVNVTPPEVSEQAAARFWNYVDKSPGQGPTGDCWAWIKSRNNTGYGQFSIGSWNRRVCSTHRMAFFLTRGYWPTWLVCHTCDWRRCCNPSHLYEGTYKMNSEDMVRKSRSARTGAKITEDQVIEIRTLVDSGKMFHRDIAAQYGLCRGTITRIANRRIWKNIRLASLSTLAILSSLVIP